MSESPYDAYPFPEPGRYPVDQLKNLRTDSAPRADNWQQWFPGEEPSKKRVLVLGCGVYEAIAIAAQEPLLDVVGLDASAKVIEITRSIAAEAGIGNVRFVHADITEEPDVGFNARPELVRTFDLVTANGVIHHVRHAPHFLETARRLLNAGGLFSLFVYGDCFREFIPRFCEVLQTLRVPRSNRGIAFVRDLIGGLPDHHPVKQFQAGVTDYDAQVADLWLHPYFRQYGAHELLGLMRHAGFEFIRWIAPEVADASVLEKMGPKYPEFVGRFITLPFEERCRIGQVLSHADLKLAAVFARV